MVFSKGYCDDNKIKVIQSNKTKESLIGKERRILNEDPEKPADTSKNVTAADESRPKQYKGRYSDDLLVATESKSDKTEKELKVLVEGLNKLIKIEKPSSKKNELILSKSAAYLNLAKFYRIKSKTPGQFKKEEELNLNNAIEISKVIEKSEFADYKQKARALHLQGMSYTFLHRDDQAIEVFIKAIAIDKTASVNPRLSIYVAEYLYDKERYLEALPKYSEYFSSLSKEEKALALYKSGWCFILTKQYANAEKTFLKIIGKKWAGDFAVDSVKDIAFSAVSHMQEQEIIDFGRANFGEQNKKVMVDFYTEAYRVMIRESANVDRPLLYNEILALDSRPERKVVISLKRLNTHQREYAAELPYQEIMEIKNLIKENNFKPNGESFKYFASEFENEIKKLVKAYADTVAKKVNPVEKLTELEVSKRLSDILMLHIEWFPDSPSVSQSYIAALDNCTIIKDAECSLKLSRDILKIESLKSVWGRAQIQLVTALEMLSQADAKYKDDYFNELITLVKSQEANVQWVALAKKLTVFYVENKKFEEAYPYLDRIYKKEATPENLYRKVYCAYELKNYIDVVSHSKLLPSKGTPFYNELIGLFRESNIQLAQDSAKGNDFNKYEEHLSEFLKLNPDEAKADFARADYFQRLLEKEQYDKLLKGLQSVNSAKRYIDPYKKTTQALLMNMFKDGKAREVFKFLSQDSTIGLYPDFNHYWFRALWVMQPFLTKKEHAILYQGNPKERNTVIGLLTLSRPAAVIQYFTDFSPRDDNEKRILLLSLQIKEGSRETILPNQYLEILQSILPPELLNTRITTSEKLVGYVEFPNVKWSEKKLERVMPDAVSRIRTIRAQVLRDVVGKGYAVQKRILSVALDSENKMVEFFKAAPVPNGMTSENEKAYREELANVSAEFAEQAGEYKKMIESIDAKLVELKKSEVQIPKNLNEWPKPNSEVTKLVDSELNERNAFGALLILESQRAFEKLSDDDYYSLRAYSVLRSLPNSVAAKYVQDELTSAKQDKLIQKWRELVENPVDPKREITSEKNKTSDKKNTDKNELDKKKKSNKDD